MQKRSRFFIASLLLGISVPAQAQLQCVPYARSVSGIAIHGNALTWWEQAEGLYPRGNHPEVNSVLAFQPTAAMPLGHVAVVAEIIDDRRIKLNHANWSRPGMIERRALAVDVSDDGDWSAVRVWYERNQSLGARINPTFGFIYGTPESHAQTDAIIAAELAEPAEAGHREG